MEVMQFALITGASNLFQGSSAPFYQTKRKLTFTEPFAFCIHTLSVLNYLNPVM